MKKHNLFKVLSITYLVAVLLTWILPSAVYESSLEIGSRNPMGLYDIVVYLIYSLRAFAPVILFVLAIGGLYGVLDKTEAYPKMVERTINWFKDKKRWFLIPTTILFVILASVTGLNLSLFIFFPFVIAVILGLGYDKLTALTVTVGSTIVGMLGATFSPTIYSLINYALKTSYTDEILGKVILLVLGTALLIFFILMYIKDKVVSEKKEDSKKSKDSAKSKKIKVAKKDEKKDKDEQVITNKVRTWPLYVIFGILFVLLVVGSIDFGTGTFFEKMHEAIMGVHIKKFYVFKSIFGSIPAIGEWSFGEYLSLSYFTFTFFIIAASLIIMLVSKMKFDDYLDNFKDGTKKVGKAVPLLALAYALVYVAATNQVYLNITNFISKLTKDFNIVTCSISMVINSIFNPDLYYYTNTQLLYYIDLLNDASINPLLGMMFTGIHSLMSLIMPSSILLILGLSYTDTKWTDWIKHIWKLFLGLLVISLITYTLILIL